MHSLSWRRILHVVTFVLFAFAVVFWVLTFVGWKYAPFLDFAADRILLRKVGGGYIFIHRLLMEYFAELEA
jgi:hypothetical protein